MDLTERIDAAILRISRGQAPMRIPVDATDPDTVLADCAARIRELEAQIAQARKAEEEAKALLLTTADAIGDIIENDERITSCPAHRHPCGYCLACLLERIEDRIRAYLDGKGE